MNNPVNFIKQPWKLFYNSIVLQPSEDVFKEAYKTMKGKRFDLTFENDDYIETYKQCRLVTRRGRRLYIQYPNTQIFRKNKNGK